jgi:pimeloyl-ACP methyl ester carboxylesterase
MNSTTSDGDRPTIVFVHGAWADASGFGGSIRALHNQGYRAIGVANPQRGLGGDAAYLGALLRTVEGADGPGRALVWRRGYLQCRDR